MYAANKYFSGNWTKTIISFDQFQQVLLPHHLGEGGRVELVPRIGGTVQDTFKFLRELPNYAKTNPYCWLKLQYFRGIPLSPIFLSTAPINRESYRAMLNFRDKLIHLDGLHRSLAWLMGGQIKPGMNLPVYIAGLNK